MPSPDIIKKNISRKMTLTYRIMLFPRLKEGLYEKRSSYVCVCLFQDQRLKILWRNINHIVHDFVLWHSSSQIFSDLDQRDLS